MERTVINNPSEVDLTGIVQPTEFCDQSGRLLGVFTPASRATASLQAELTLEQLRAIVAEPEGYELEEIWRELGAK